MRRVGVFCGSKVGGPPVYAASALRLGTLDAAKFFHRGVIERCLGHRAAARHWFARAHETNPYWRQP